MKRFEPFEKNLMRIITTDRLDNASKNVVNLFDYLVQEYNVSIEFIYDNSSILAYTNYNDMNDIKVLHKLTVPYTNKEIKEIRNKFITVISLLEYLEKQNLIYLYLEWNPDWDKVSVTGKPPLIYKQNGIKIFGDELSKTIVEKSKYNVFAKQELYEIVGNDFKTAEQRRHEDNMKMQKLTVISAIWIGIISIFLSCLGILFSAYIDLLK